MQTWGWLLAYVVGFGLLQLYLFRYFRREEPGPDTTPSRTDGSGGAVSVESRRNDRSGVHCRHCGTRNEYEATFAYCRECVEPLY